MKSLIIICLFFFIFVAGPVLAFFFAHQFWPTLVELSPALIILVVAYGGLVHDRQNLKISRLERKLQDLQNRVYRDD